MSGAISDQATVPVPPGEFRSLVNLLDGFLQDFTPVLEAEVVSIPIPVLSALMALAESLVARDEQDAMELAYIKTTLEALSCQSDTRS